jgi:hypothetical protein
MLATADRAPRRNHALTAIGLGLLLLLASFYLFGAVSDLASVSSHNLPPDHRGTFAKLTGTSFSHVRAASPGLASYISLLERGYAFHELTFALLFIVLLAIPFRQRRPWAWWAAWLPMIANLGYLFTFGVHDPAVLTRSLIADIALPVLLLAHIPAFFTPHGKPDAPRVVRRG